jgi:hypothetical protein
MKAGRDFPKTCKLASFSRIEWNSSLFITMNNYAWISDDQSALGSSFASPADADCLREWRIILKLYRFKKLGGDKRIRRHAVFREREKVMSVIFPE